MEEGNEMKLLPLCTLGLLTVLTPFTVVQAADDSANLLRDPNRLLNSYLTSRLLKTWFYPAVWRR